MQVFEMVPAGMRPLWLFIPIVLAVLAGLFITAMSVLGMRTVRFELSDNGLRLRGDWYGRLIPINELRGGSARRLDLGRAGGLQPTVRTLGTGLPGYRVGWFRLKNGQKALLYVTDPTRVVYVPTRSGYALLLSVRQPDEFVRALREAAPAT